MIRKGRLLLLGLVAAGVFLSQGLISGAPAAKEPYKVGAIFAITGPAAWLGTPERNTAKMIEEQVNMGGGINGHPLEVIIEDTVGDATKTVTAAKKLITKDKVLAIVGPSRSGTTMAVIPIAEEAKVPLVSCAAAESIVVPVKPWVFKTPPKGQ
ncbi:MAG: ABC transporter substrate-binding protein [bacterium]